MGNGIGGIPVQVPQHGANILPSQPTSTNLQTNVPYNMQPVPTQSQLINPTASRVIPNSVVMNKPPPLQMNQNMVQPRPLNPNIRSGYK